MAFAYPSAVPVNELLAVISVIKNNTVADNVESVAHDLWVVQGYAQSTLIGNPVTAQSAVAVYDESDDDLVKVQKVADYLSAPTAQAVIPNEILTMLATWAAQQLLSLLNKYFTK